MSRLAETQCVVRDAVVTGEPARAQPLLVGGGDPAKRLAIHHRHYRSSLMGTLLTRFPALTWLVGGRVIEDAADRYVREHPPAAPCLAEYGGTFPAFVAHRLEPRLAFVRPFGELEWHVGAVSIAVDLPPYHVDSLPVDADALAEAIAALQPGLRFLRTEWPVHDLMRCFLTDTAPETYELTPSEAWIEIRGARGEFEINSLDAATWTFRVELQRGTALEVAAMRALAIDDAFDPGQALLALVSARLLTDLEFPLQRVPS